MNSYDISRKEEDSTGLLEGQPYLLCGYDMSSYKIITLSIYDLKPCAIICDVISRNMVLSTMSRLTFKLTLNRYHFLLLPTVYISHAGITGYGAAFN